MFHTLITIYSPKKKIEPRPQLVCSLIEPIRRSKYPAITPEEEAMGSSLQILCLAILDSIFVHIANLAAQTSWESIRRNLCKALIKEKEQQVCRILERSYGDQDVIFIQEAAAALVQQVSRQTELSAKFFLLVPAKLDSKRDQNSLIFVARGRFEESSSIDVTAHVAETLEGDFVDAGDLFVVSILGLGGLRWLLASFHGDSNGLSSQPVMSALRRAHRTTFKDHILLAGIDANTQSHGHDRYHHGVGQFRALLRTSRMVSVWDGEQDPLLKTTCSARTSLQPQLNKAVPFHRRFSGATVSLKDWILGCEWQVRGITDARRDNTGEGRCVEDMMLPTTDFPSDHMIVSAAFHIAPAPVAWPELEPPESRRGSLSSTGSLCDDPPAATGGEPSRDEAAAWAGGTQGGAVGQGGSRTLYDVWGIHGELEERPFARLPSSGFGRLPSSGVVVSSELQEHEAGGGGGGGGVFAALDSDIEFPGDAAAGGVGVGGEGLDLEAQLRRCIYAISRQSAVWILFSSRPLAIARCKAYLVLLLMFTAVPRMFEGIYNVRDALAHRPLEGRAFRLTPVDPHHAFDACPHAPGGHLGGQLTLSAASMALLRAGRPVPADRPRRSCAGSGLRLDFAASVAVDGWEAAASNFSWKPPLRLRVETSSDGAAWRDEPLPRWARFELRAAPSGGGGSGGAQVVWDLRPDWQVLGAMQLQSDYLCARACVQSWMRVCKRARARTSAWFVCVAVHVPACVSVRA